MGNRAVITWGNRHNYQTKVGIYLHWNGGRDSVEAFLKFCDLMGYRCPPDSYGIARLTQVITNFFGSGGLSCGVDICANLDCDNWDNGVYLCDGWKITDRLFFKGEEQTGHDMANMLAQIADSMPMTEEEKRELTLRYMKETVKDAE